MSNTTVYSVQIPLTPPLFRVLGERDGETPLCCLSSEPRSNPTLCHGGEGGLYDGVTPLLYKPSAKQHPLPAIQVVRLLPQRVSLELPERLLDPRPRFRILRDGPRCRRRADQQAQFATEEDPGDGEEGVGCDISERGRLQ